MHEGCATAMMRSSVHPDSGFGGGYVNDSFYSYPQHHQHNQRHQNYRHHQQQQQNIHQLPFLEHEVLGQKIYSPLSPLVPSSIPTTPGRKIYQNVLLNDLDSASKKQRFNSGGSIAAVVARTPPHEILGDTGDVEVMGVASPKIFDRRTVEARYQDAGELGSVVVGARRRLSWMTREELVQQQHPGFQSSCCKTSLISSPSPSLPRLGIHSAHVLSSPSSPLSSPAIPASPDCQNPEPRSVLDFSTSPPTIAGCAATPSFDFAASSLEDGLILDDVFFNDFHRPDCCSAASQMSSPTNPSSPDCEISEPNSVLDFARSPPPLACLAATPSYDFASGSVGGGVLLADDLFSDFNEKNSSLAAVAAAKLLGLEDDEDKPPHTSAAIEWFQQASPLWTNSLIDDLTETTLADEGPLTDIPSSPPCPSTSKLCYPSPSFDRQQSHQGEEEEITYTASSGALGIARAEKGDALSHLTREVDQKLVNLLLASAEAVSTKTLSLVNPLFAQLGELASPEGTTMQRLGAYITEGLAIRCTTLWPQIYQPLPQNLDLSEEENLSAFHTLNQVCPYIKFAHFTANDIILQAFEGCNRVHVIDFDIKQGLQWPALFQSLAARVEGPPTCIRVTGIGECKDDVMDTGDRLAEFAETLHLPFEFHAVIDKLEDVRLWMLHVKEKETVAVNCVLQLHRALCDPQNGIKNMLGLIASTKPRVVAVVEQEASHNGDFFEGISPRFLAAFQYYAAIFDSLNANMRHNPKARLKVEKFFAMEIRNILACEGPERKERHEGIKTWRLYMDSGGFKSVPVGKRARTLARLLLDFFACKSYTISDDDEDEYTLTLGWEGRSLFTASAWAPKL